MSSALSPLLTPLLNPNTKIKSVVFLCVINMKNCLSKLAACAHDGGKIIQTRLTFLKIRGYFFEYKWLLVIIVIIIVLYS